MSKVLLAQTPRLKVVGVKKKSKSKIAQTIDVGDIMRIDVPVGRSGDGCYGGYAMTVSLVNQTKGTNDRITMNDARSYFLNIFDLREI